MRSERAVSSAGEMENSEASKSGIHGFLVSEFKILPEPITDASDDRGCRQQGVGAPLRGAQNEPISSRAQAAPRGAARPPWLLVSPYAFAGAAVRLFTAKGSKKPVWESGILART